jgi:hypothetical protein
MQYAKQCDESISDLIRKVLIREATLADLEVGTDSQYQIRMKVASEFKPLDELDQVESNFNKNRRILGMKELRL